MWVYRNGACGDRKPVVLYDYQPTRKTDHPEKFLKDYNGTLVTDGYQVYHTLEAERDEARQQVESLTAERDAQMNKAVEAENKVTDLTEQVNALNEQKDNLTNEVATLNEQVKAKDEEIHNLKEQLGSNFVPQQRMNGIPAGEGKQDGKQQDSEERKNEVRDKLGRNKK